MIKAVFVDFDESLYSHKAAKIPDSAYSAILKAQENGVLIVLATGRALCELDYFDLRNIKFDGYVLNNGQLILDSQYNTLWANYIEGKNKELIVSKFVSNEVPMMLTTDNSNFMNYTDELTLDAFNSIDSKLPDIKKYENENIMMATIFLDTNKEKEYLSEFNNLTLTWWHKNSADIVSKGGSKMKGIREYLLLNKLSIDDVMGIGDGDNDIEMVLECKVGVAMGNSIKEVKDVADFITSNIDDDGLYNAFKQYNIMIKAILFDLDNTLIDRQKAFTKMLNRTFHLYYQDENYINELIKDTLLFDDGGKIERIDAFTKLIEKYNIKEFTAEEISNSWSKESGSVVYLFDDVIDTLTNLKTKYKLAIVTNGNYESQKRKLDNINLYDLLDYTLISDEIGIRKPDARIYQYAAKQMNLDVSECIYVGDSYSRDIVGAFNANMKPIYVCRNNEEHKDVDTIYNIKDLLKLL